MAAKKRSRRPATRRNGRPLPPMSLREALARSGDLYATTARAVAREHPTSRIRYLPPNTPMLVGRYRPSSGDLPAPVRRALEKQGITAEYAGGTTFRWSAFVLRRRR